ncbi:helix-turn-helix transcriptional regulator [Brevibacterium aurantiacum]|uniref:helix-turn-helix transcriptional regulator n=1 Tax=Brevibacterium aurantiacum TaxID=273384 RepID=UPI0018661B8E|nr:helix-turn-helix domain-containing protein [Brevibacterium aurantiacum]
MTDNFTDQGAALIAEIESYLAEARSEDHLRPEVVNEKEAARIAGVSVQWLRNNRKSPAAPPFCKIGSRVRYRPESLRAWVRQQEVKY